MAYMGLSQHSVLPARVISWKEIDKTLCKEL